MAEKKNLEEWLNQLEQSSMFHLSLCSKELFHSNFLYWLSIKDWEVFMSVMHSLAEEEKFWWEDAGFKHSDDPQDNDIEVRRESRNFDLSIFVRTQKSTADKQQEDADEKGRKDVWVPVFLLENKMKSLPRHEQLQEYVRKAFNDWKRGKDNKQIDILWQQQPISFVLLSLYLPSDTLNLCKCNHQYIYGSKNKKLKIDLECSWIAKDYGQLYNILFNQNLQQSYSLDQQILNDYCKFIQALHEIAQTDWKVLPKDDFVQKIYPWAQKDYLGDRQTRLRIDDIRQKVHYAQLQSMLEKKLEDAGVEAKHVSEDKKAPIWFATNFAHNIGILEVSIKFPKGEDGSIFLQLQGNSYCHAFCKEGGASEQMLKFKDRLDLLMEFEEDVKTTSKFPSLLNTNELHPGGINSRAKKKQHFKNFKYYSDNFIYQNVLIPQGVTVENVIDAMVEDTKRCMSLWGV